MSNVNALMGLGLDDIGQQQAMADRLRGQQNAGNYLSLSSISPISQMGQNMLKGVDASATNVGALNKARTLAQAKTDAAIQGNTWDKEKATALGKTKATAAAKLATANQARDAAKGEQISYEDPNNPNGQINFIEFGDGRIEDYQGNPVDPTMLENLKQLPSAGSTNPSATNPTPKGAKKFVDQNGKQYLLAQIGDQMYDMNSRSFIDPSMKVREAYDISTTEAENLSKNADMSRALGRLRDSMPEGAGARDGDLPFEALVRTRLGQFAPFLGETDWTSAENASWWGDKESFVDNIMRHEIFGGALSRPELLNWAKGNVSPKNTKEQIMNKLAKYIQSKDSAAQSRLKNLVARGLPIDTARSYGLRGEYADGKFTQPEPNPLRDMTLDQLLARKAALEAQ